MNGAIDSFDKVRTLDGLLRMQGIVCQQSGFQTAHYLVDELMILDLSIGELFDKTLGIHCSCR